MAIESGCELEIYPQFSEMLDLLKDKSSFKNYNKRTQAIIIEYLDLTHSSLWQIAHEAGYVDILSDLIQKARETVIRGNSALWISLSEIEATGSKKKKAKKHSNPAGRINPAILRLIDCMSSSLCTDADGSHLWVNEAEILSYNFYELEQKLYAYLAKSVNPSDFEDVLDVVGFSDRLQFALALEATLDSRAIVSEYL